MQINQIETRLYYFCANQSKTTVPVKACSDNLNKFQEKKHRA
jgi:hypothetical protein